MENKQIAYVSFFNYKLNILCATMWRIINAHLTVGIYWIVHSHFRPADTSHYSSHWPERDQVQACVNGRENITEHIYTVPTGVDWSLRRLSIGGKA